MRGKELDYLVYVVGERTKEFFNGNFLLSFNGLIMKVTEGEVGLSNPIFNLVFVPACFCFALLLFETWVKKIGSLPTFHNNIDLKWWV